MKKLVLLTQPMDGKWDIGWGGCRSFFHVSGKIYHRKNFLFTFDVHDVDRTEAPAYESRDRIFNR
ncbi:hypothetical protein B2D07_00250 [Desulfococcus multivorans]|nr:hypothetical protein B2D07_00250 [Desulfococcus multivorans]